MKIIRSTPNDERAYPTEGMQEIDQWLLILAAVFEVKLISKLFISFSSSVIVTC